MVKVKKSQVFKFIAQILIVAAVGLIGGCAFKNFFEAQDLVPTGLSGFALLVKTWIGYTGLNLSTSLIYLIMNVVLFALSIKFFGWKFLVLSGVGLGTYVAGMEYGYIAQIATDTSDPLLYCFIGAIFMGLATGIAIRMGGSTGGSDILGTLVNRIFPKIKTGYAILSVNVVVLTLNVITNGLQTGFYSLLIAIIASLVTNMVLDNSKKIIAFHIVCDKPDEISQAILSQYKRGVTRLDGKGMFTGKEKAILLCLVPYDQSYKIREFITKIDKNAFVYSTPVTETIGETKIFSKPLLSKDEALTSISLPEVVIPTKEEVKEDKNASSTKRKTKEVAKTTQKKKMSTNQEKKPASKAKNSKTTSSKSKTTNKKTSSKTTTSKQTKKAD